MRWITFLILLLAMAALQDAQLGGFPHGPKDVWPMVEYLPLLAVFYALFAAETAALLAAAACGAMYDLVDGTYLGTNMIPLALVAWAILGIRLSIFREHAISQVIMTLVAVLAFAVLSALWRKMLGAPLQGLGIWPHVGRLAGNAVYTAVVAPAVMWVLFRLKGILGFPGRRREF